MKAKIWIMLIVFVIFCTYSIANYYKDERAITEMNGIIVIDSKPVIWVADVQKDDVNVFIEELRREDERSISRMIGRESQINISSIKPTNYSIDRSQLNESGFVGIYIELEGGR